MIIATATRPNSAGGMRCARTTAEPTAVTSAAIRASVAHRRLLNVFSLSSERETSADGSASGGSAASGADPGWSGIGL